jgi:glycosyltransferase involved in cell wall biosynthesis
VKRILTLSVDQLYRRQPGGIGTYVCGLVQGLAGLAHSDLEVLGLAPSGAVPPEAKSLALRLVKAPLAVGPLTRVWPIWPLGVARASNIVHATSMAGPFGGGAAGCVHSAAVHDLLWRDEPNATTRAGARFHEDRLRLLARREEIRVFTTSPGLRERLLSEGFAPARVRYVRLGADDAGEAAASQGSVRDLLARHDVVGPFTLYAGTREPRKNLGRLIAAHRAARHDHAELGPLVICGPSGWGGVDTEDATVLGLVDRDLLKGLMRDATVFAYVALAEGWGLPPVEALHAGTRVVASSTTPSVSQNPQVVVVDPLDVSSIAAGLLSALELDEDTAGAQRRRDSVGELTWANSALDHLEGWK